MHARWGAPKSATGGQMQPMAATIRKGSPAVDHDCRGPTTGVAQLIPVQRTRRLGRAGLRLETH
eukprot:6315680-Lingulodinium_polyedra.AAC.1